VKRAIRIEGDVSYITLTQGYEAVIDTADVPLLEGWNWQAGVDENTVYAMRNARSNGRWRKIQMHRVLLNDPDGLVVDHIDGDGLNNRRANLRAVTTQQNAFNQRAAKGNTSGFKGVTWIKQGKKWQASIKLNGKSRHLGRFATAEEAHDAYVKASAELHGEFGRTA
jgi:hypothetical protein